MYMDALKEAWVPRMVFAMQTKFPSLSPEKIEEMVNTIYENTMKNHDVQIYNSYEDILMNTNLIDVLNWIQNTKPLIADSGVFFYPKDKKRNVNIEIIKEDMLEPRKIHKKEMFQALEAGDAFTAAAKNKQQLNDKKAANSEYGAEGQSSSFLYNLHSAMSVTACGRGQLSNACQCFENLLADNVKFFHLNEFYNFIYNIVNEQPLWQYDTYKFISVVPSEKQFVERFRRKFGHESLFQEEYVKDVYHYLSDELRIRVYYKSNLNEFILFPSIANKLIDIEGTDIEYVDPNELPKGLEKKVNQFVDIVLEFVGYRYSVFRYEDRTKYLPRAVTPIMDTDSNFINLGVVLDYLKEHVLPISLRINPKWEEEKKLRVLNTLAVLLTKAITQTLYHYLGTANVAEEDRHYVNMKNEYYYSRVVTTFAKKSYIGLQKRKEAVLFKGPEIDVKGVNFFKSTASEDTSKFIYDEILLKRLLCPPSGVPSLKDIYRAIYEFQKKITKEISEGHMGYLKRSIRVKSEDAYTNPMRIGNYKAVYVWNHICEEVEQIKLPATVTIVKVKLTKKSDVSALSEWPDIYQKIMYLFEHDPNIGEYVDEEGNRVPAKGINTIALPEDYDEVPKWILSIIDTETLVEDNMKLFTQLYAPLGLTPGKTSVDGKNRKYYTNVVRI